MRSLSGDRPNLRAPTPARYVCPASGPDSIVSSAWRPAPDAGGTVAWAGPPMTTVSTGPPAGGATGGGCQAGIRVVDSWPSSGTMVAAIGATGSMAGGAAGAGAGIEAAGGADSHGSVVGGASSATGGAAAAIGGAVNGGGAGAAGGAVNGGGAGAAVSTGGGDHGAAGAGGAAHEGAAGAGIGA